MDRMPKAQFCEENKVEIIPGEIGAKKVKVKTEVVEREIPWIIW